MKIGLFFGTFNPFHNGHMAVANYVVENTDIDEVWFVVSPDSEFKEHDCRMIPFDERCRLVSMDSRSMNSHMRVCDIERTLPSPHYTVNTVEAIKAQYPFYEFSVLLGEDNIRAIRTFHDWEALVFGNIELLGLPRRYDPTIKDTFSDFVKTLCKEEGKAESECRISVIEGCPSIDMSSSFIRQQMKEGKRVAAYVPPDTLRYLRRHPFV